jgi:hypothetical protein
LPVDNLAVKTSGPAWREAGLWVSIYGNSPLPDPEHFFVEFHDLTLKIGALQPPIDYTPFATFATFKRFVVERSYKLLSAPQEIAEGVCRLLDARNVNYSSLPESRLRQKDQPGLIEVEIGECWALCRSALVLAT